MLNFYHLKIAWMKNEETLNEEWRMLEWRMKNACLKRFGMLNSISHKANNALEHLYLNSVTDKKRLEYSSDILPKI